MIFNREIIISRTQKRKIIQSVPLKNKVSVFSVQRRNDDEFDAITQFHST